MKALRALWQDEAGFVISSELLLIVTIAVIGLLVGLVAVRDAVVQELGDVAAAIGALDQSYYYHGVSNTATNAYTNGTQFSDQRDMGDLPWSQTAATMGGITVMTGVSAG